MLWLEALVVNYLQANDLVLSITHGATNITLTSSRSPCLIVGCSKFDGPIYHIYIIHWYCVHHIHVKHLTTPVQVIIVLASLDISFSTSKCRPRPDKGSLSVCVQNTKTLHAQHKRNILRYTCVFSRSWQLTSTAETANNSAVDRTIQSNPCKGHSLDPWMDLRCCGLKSY